MVIPFFRKCMNFFGWCRLLLEKGEAAIQMQLSILSGIFVGVNLGVSVLHVCLFRWLVVCSIHACCSFVKTGTRLVSNGSKTNVLCLWHRYILKAFLRKYFKISHSTECYSTSNEVRGFSVSQLKAKITKFYGPWGSRRGSLQKVLHSSKTTKWVFILNYLTRNVPNNYQGTYGNKTQFQRLRPRVWKETEQVKMHKQMFGLSKWKPFLHQKFRSFGFLLALDWLFHATFCRKTSVCPLWKSYQCPCRVWTCCCFGRNVKRQKCGGQSGIFIYVAQKKTAPLSKLFKNRLLSLAASNVYQHLQQGKF